MFASAEKRNRLLRSVAGGGLEQLQRLKSQWDKFELMMESHQLMIQEQVGGGWGGDGEGGGEREQDGKRRKRGVVLMRGILISKIHM